MTMKKTINNNVFELKIMTMIELNGDNYESISCMHHDCGCNSWRKQDRKDWTLIKCVNSDNVFK